jgi:hypothetical protein
MAECKAAKVDERSVERYAGLEQIDEERFYYTNAGGELRQRFQYTGPARAMTGERGDGERQSRKPRPRAAGRVGGGGASRVPRLRRAAGAGGADAARGAELPDGEDGRAADARPDDAADPRIRSGIRLELERILGDERNYAGTSFVRPEMFGEYQYGSRLLNVTFDPTHREELASYAFDDEGTEAKKVFLIRDGILVGAARRIAVSSSARGMRGTAKLRGPAVEPPADRTAWRT